MLDLKLRSSTKIALVLFQNWSDFFLDELLDLFRGSPNEGRRVQQRVQLSPMDRGKVGIRADSGKK